jgi:hypothetical protein
MTHGMGSAVFHSLPSPRISEPWRHGPDPITNTSERRLLVIHPVPRLSYRLPPELPPMAEGDPIQPITDGRSQPRRQRRQGERAAATAGRARHRRQEPDHDEEARRGWQGGVEAAAAPRHHVPLPRRPLPVSTGARGRGAFGRVENSLPSQGLLSCWDN